MADAEVAAGAPASGIALLDGRGLIVWTNAAVDEVFGYSPGEISGRPFDILLSEHVQQSFRTELERIVRGPSQEKKPVGRELQARRKDGSTFPIWIEPSPLMLRGESFVFASIVDLAERSRSKALADGLKRVFEMIADGRPLPETLDQILRVVEAYSDDMLCSILLLDADGIHVRHGAAPQLPAEYTRAIDGLPIGPCAGSCGTAAFRRASVFVEDIASDPLWADYKHLALSYGLRACWSTPIIDRSEIVLGTFAIYYRRSALPTAEHRRVIDIVTHTAAICISRHRAEQALRDSEQHFRQIAESLPQMVWTTDAEGHGNFLSKRWRDYTGTPAEAQADAKWPDRIHPDDRERQIEIWRSVLASGNDYKIESRIRRHDGVYRWFDTHAVPLRDGEGRILKWFGTNTDIDDARAMREALVQEKARLDKIVATAPGAIYSFRLRPDGSSHYAYAGAAIRDIFGVDPEALAIDARPGFSLIHVEDARRVWQTLNDSARDLSIWHLEFRVAHPAKGEIWVEARAAPTREVDGSTLWHGFLADVTARKHAEHEITDSRARLVAALKMGRMGTWMWDVGDDSLVMDEIAQKLFGRTSEELSGTFKESLRFIHPDDHERLLTNAGIVAGGEGEIGEQFRVMRPDGSVTWITARGGVVERDAQGRPLRMAGVNMDITAHKRFEEMELRSQKLEALGTLAGGIAHDFNNILLAITGNTRLAIADLPPGHLVQQSLAEIAKASARATDLVRRILTFSQPQDQKRVPTQLASVVDEALSMLRATLPAMIDIRTQFAKDTPAVAADPAQIHQIIVNLATNAAYAIGSRHGRIEFSIRPVNITSDLAESAPHLREGRYVLLSVSDSGAGMDAQTLPRIFDPFFTTKPPGQGSGLGLSVVHGIVKSHGGGVAVYSQPGKGATLRLYFPVTEAAASESRPAVAAIPSGHGERVLYLDDEQALVYLAARVLKRLGYQVTGFTEPAGALAAFSARPLDFDVVVTDLSMPGMTGFEFAEAILLRRPEIPVLMTSGYVRPEDQDAARRIGILALLLKPDTVEKLGEELDRLFRLERTPAKRGEYG